MSETSAAMWEVAQMWGAHTQMNEDLSDDELQPTKFPKRAGKGAGKLEKRPREPQTAPPRGPKQAHLLTLARMMARHEMALQQLEADRSWVIFVDSGSLGIINQLMLTTATWKKQRSKNECSCSLRQALMGAMLMELEARMVKLETDVSAQTPLEDPLAGPLAVAVHEVELRKESPRADRRGAAGTLNGPDSTSRAEVPHLARGRDARIPCNGRYERGEGGCHVVQVDPVDGNTSQSIHPRDPHTVHGILDAQADRSPATPGEEPSATAKRTATASSARTVKPLELEPSSAPAAPGECHNSLTQDEPPSAPNLILQSGGKATNSETSPDKGRPQMAPKASSTAPAPQAKGRPKSAPHTKGGNTDAPKQTIFSMGRTKTLEKLPAGVLSEDLQRNDRHKGAQGKLNSGPQSSGNDSTVGKLSTTTTTGHEAGNLSAWLLRGAVRKPAIPGKNAQSARTVFSATDLADPVQTILANPSNYCYLNSLVQALLWIYQARPSARNSEFGDLHALLRPLLTPGTAVQLHRRKAWLRLLETWPNPQQQHDVAELLVHIQRKARFPALVGKWEARTMQGPHFQVHQSATQVPHIMLPCKSNKTLQELVEQWAYDQDTGQVCAITEAPAFLCIQLLRFQGNMDGEINKLSHPTPLSPKLQVPTFTEGIDTRPQAYVLHSVVYHIGCTPDSGHYRTMGITAPKGEPSSFEEAFYSEITRSLSEGAAHPALHVQNDATPTALATSTDLQEVSRTWYLAFFSKPQ